MSHALLDHAHAHEDRNGSHGRSLGSLAASAESENKVLNTDPEYEINTVTNTHVTSAQGQVSNTSTHAAVDFTSVPQIPPQPPSLLPSPLCSPCTLPGNCETPGESTSDSLTLSFVSSDHSAAPSGSSSDPSSGPFSAPSVRDPSLTLRDAPSNPSFGPSSGSPSALSVSNSAPGSEVDPEQLCSLCGTSFTHRQMALQHYSGRRHHGNFGRRKFIQELQVEPDEPLHCSVCSVHFSSVEMYQEHKQGVKHLNRERMVLEMCRTQEAVYDTFIDELQDYIRARGVQPVIPAAQGVQPVTSVAQGVQPVISAAQGVQPVNQGMQKELPVETVPGDHEGFANELLDDIKSLPNPSPARLMQHFAPVWGPSTHSLGGHTRKKRLEPSPESSLLQASSESSMERTARRRQSSRRQKTHRRQKRERVNMEEGSVLQGELQQGEPQEERVKHRSRTGRKKCEVRDTRTEEEKLWDESILGCGGFNRTEPQDFFRRK